MIKAFDRVCEVQSDKATVEITSRFDGIISKVYHKEGEIVKVSWNIKLKLETKKVLYFLLLFLTGLKSSMLFCSHRLEVL